MLYKARRTIASRLSAMGSDAFAKGNDALFGALVAAAHTIDPVGPWKKPGASFYRWWESPADAVAEAVVWHVQRTVLQIQAKAKR
jgi:hypothetical protein